MFSGLGGGLVGLVLVVACGKKIWGEVKGAGGLQKEENQFVCRHLHVYAAVDKFKRLLL